MFLWFLMYLSDFWVVYDGFYICWCFGEVFEWFFSLMVFDTWNASKCFKTLQTASKRQHLHLQQLLCYESICSMFSIAELHCLQHLQLSQHLQHFVHYRICSVWSICIAFAAFAAFAFGAFAFGAFAVLQYLLHLYLHLQHDEDECPMNEWWGMVGMNDDEWWEMTTNEWFPISDQKALKPVKIIKKYQNTTKRF